MVTRLRKVTTASSASAAEIVRKQRGKLSVMKHLGSVHTQAELTDLFAAGEEKIADYGETNNSKPNWACPRMLPCHRGHET